MPTAANTRCMTAANTRPDRAQTIQEGKYEPNTLRSGDRAQPARLMQAAGARALEDLLKSARTSNLAPGLSTDGRPVAESPASARRETHGDLDVPRRRMGAESPKEGVVAAAALSENRPAQERELSENDVQGAALRI